MCSAYASFPEVLGYRKRRDEVDHGIDDRYVQEERPLIYEADEDEDDNRLCSDSIYRYKAILPSGACQYAIEAEEDRQDQYDYTYVKDIDHAIMAQGSPGNTGEGGASLVVVPVPGARSPEQSGRILLLSRPGDRPPGAHIPNFVV